MFPEEHRLLVKLQLTRQGFLQENLREEFCTLVRFQDSRAQLREWREEGGSIQACLAFSNREHLESARFFDGCLWNDFAFLSLSPSPRSSKDSRATAASIPARTAAPSPVLYLSEIETALLGAQRLAELFGVFGPVACVFVMKNLRKAMLEFRVVESAARAADFFASSRLFALSYSRHRSVQPPAKLGKHNEFFEPGPAGPHQTPPSQGLRLQPRGSPPPPEVALQAIRLLAPAAKLQGPPGPPPQYPLLLLLPTLEEAILVFCSVRVQGLCGTPFLASFLLSCNEAKSAISK